MSEAENIEQDFSNDPRFTIALDEFKKRIGENAPPVCVTYLGSTWDNHEIYRARVLDSSVDSAALAAAFAYVSALPLYDVKEKIPSKYKDKPQLNGAAILHSDGGVTVDFIYEALPAAEVV